MTDASPAAAPAPTAPAAAPPAPLRVGAVIGTSFSVWARHLLPFSAVALVAQSPVLLLEAAGADPSSRGIQFVSNLLMLMASGAITSGVLRALHGDAPRIGKMLGVGMTRCFRLLGVAFLTGLATFLGFVALVVPGLIALSTYYAAIPAATVEDRGVSAAISRSQELTKGRRWGVLPVAVLFTGLSLAPGLLFFAVFAAFGLEDSRVAVLVSDVLTAVLGGLSATGAAVTYHDLRVSREGVDTAQLAAVFE